MRELERLLLARGYCHIAGIDEAGRGPLAGPVVAAAANIPLDCNLSSIQDSKTLNVTKRMYLFNRILEVGSVGVGVASPKEIDELNILQATFVAMKRAVRSLQQRISVDYCLVDGNHAIPDLELSQKTIVKGDSTSYLIAAASIVAKVYRDNLMKEYDVLYPIYGFAQHKGYPTKAHYNALTKYGPSPIHRYSFRGVKKGYLS